MSPNKHLRFRILFVCQGNICRSPMAAALAPQMLPAGVQVDSAGINPYGLQATPEAIEVVQIEYKLDISGHRPQDVAALNLADFDYIIALDSPVFYFLERNYPRAAAKLIRWNIADPYFGGMAAYFRCLSEIKLNLVQLDGLLAAKPIN